MLYRLQAGHWPAGKRNTESAREKSARKETRPTCFHTFRFRRNIRWHAGQVSWLEVILLAYAFPNSRPYIAPALQWLAKRIAFGLYAVVLLTVTGGCCGMAKRRRRSLHHIPFSPRIHAYESARHPAAWTARLTRAAVYSIVIPIFWVTSSYGNPAGKATAFAHVENIVIKKQIKFRSGVDRMWSVNDVY